MSSTSSIEIWLASELNEEGSSGDWFMKGLVISTYCGSILLFASVEYGIYWLFTKQSSTWSTGIISCEFWYLLSVFLVLLRTEREKMWGRWKRRNWKAGTESWNGKLERKGLKSGSDRQRLRLRMRIHWWASLHVGETRSDGAGVWKLIYFNPI